MYYTTNYKFTSYSKNEAFIYNVKLKLHQYNGLSKAKMNKVNIQTLSKYCVHKIDLKMFFITVNV